MEPRKVNVGLALIAVAFMGLSLAFTCSTRYVFSNTINGFFTYGDVKFIIQMMGFSSVWIFVGAIGGYLVGVGLNRGPKRKTNNSNETTAQQPRTN